MTTNYPENQENRKKSRIFPSSVILAVTAIIITLLCLWCKDNRAILEKEKLAVIQQRDSLAGEMKKIEDQVSILKSEKEILNQTIEKESAEKKQIINEKAFCASQVKKANKTNSVQKERINLLLNKNDSLFNMISLLEGKMDDLNRKIAQSDKDAELLRSNINSLNGDIQQKEVQITQISDSMILEHKADSVRILPVFVALGEITEEADCVTHLFLFQGILSVEPSV